MHNDFSRTFNRLLTASGKSLTQLAAITGIDRAYLLRLSTGEKRHPRPELVVKIWIGLVFDPGLLRHDPMMVHGLTDLLLAAGMTATSTEALTGSERHMRPPTRQATA
jgi:hypothetical protein